MRGKYKRVAGWKAKDCDLSPLTWYERGGEIDLIMREGRTTVFVEVRYRRSALYGGAAASVTRSKQHKLLQTARLWLARHNGSFDTVDCRFDVVAFTGNEVEWIKDAFNDHS